jgi:CDP-glucose 4,6-dehydratase
MILNGTTGEWNFGPSLEEKYTVGELATHIAAHYGITKAAWISGGIALPKEASYLLLDSSSARLQLGWRDRLDFYESIKWSMNWYISQDLEPLERTKVQIENYLKLAKE